MEMTDGRSDGPPFLDCVPLGYFLWLFGVEEGARRSLRCTNSSLELKEKRWCRAGVLTCAL